MKHENLNWLIEYLKTKWMDSCRVGTIYQRETLLMIADVIPATIGTKIPASLQTQAPQTDLQYHTRHMKPNGIIVWSYEVLI